MSAFFHFCSKHPTDDIKNEEGQTPHLSLGGVVLHQGVVGEGVAANHRAAGARHSIQRLFLGGRGLASTSTGWKFGCAKLKSNIGKMRIRNG